MEYLGQATGFVLAFLPAELLKSDFFANPRQLVSLRNDKQDAAPSSD